MLLYHCKLGCPLLSEHAKLVLPAGRKTTPRSEYAKTGLGHECEFSPPIDGEEEQVFFHEMAEPWVSLENPAVGVALRLKWSGDTLPVLAEWKSMASGDYVLGLEPSNNFIMGRAAERENGTLQTLGAFERIRTTLEFNFETNVES